MNTISISIDVKSMDAFFSGDQNRGTILIPYDADPFSTITTDTATKETTDSFIVRFYANQEYSYIIQSANTAFQYVYLKFTQVSDSSNFVEWTDIFQEISAENYFINERFELIIPSTDFSFETGEMIEKNNLTYSVIFSYIDSDNNLKWGSLDPLVDLKNFE